jgi:hypothetical protein
MTEVNSNGCQYVRLSQYNSAAGGCISNSNCQPPGGGQYMVPHYGQIGFNSLTVAPMSPPSARALPNCVGYRNIETAYGKNAGSGSCGSFAPTSCN